MADINKGYNGLDRNKVEDAINQYGAVNAQGAELDQQVQDLANEQPAPAA